MWAKLTRDKCGRKSQVTNVVVVDIDAAKMDGTDK